MTAPEAKPLADTAAALLKDLRAQYPVFAEFRPLAIGVDKVLMQRDPALDKKALRFALRLHTASTRYLKEMQLAKTRFDLEGQAAGEIDDAQREHAAGLLRERFKKKADQHRAEENARKEAEKAAEAERQRLAKLNQLTEKFGRKGR